MNQKLKFQLPEKEEVEIDYESMQRLLEDIKVNKFETLFPFFKASCSDTEVYADCCAMFMEMAVERSYINVVDLLIDFASTSIVWRSTASSRSRRFSSLRRTLIQEFSGFSCCSRKLSFRTTARD